MASNVRNTSHKSNITTGDIALLSRVSSKSELESFREFNNTPDVKSLCISHGLAQIINNKLKVIRTEHQLPQSLCSLQSELSSYSQQKHYVSSIIDSSAMTLLQKLKKEGIIVIVLKGFSLSYQLYNEPHLRPRTDIDILINSEDKDAAIAIFTEQGYSNPRGWEPQAIINQFSMKKELAHGTNVLFDVHIKISNSKPIEDILNYQELLQTSNQTAVPNLYLINKPHALVHAVFHLLHHKSSGDLIKLIWYYDIFLLVKQLKNEELQQLKTIIDSKGLAKIVSHTLHLTYEYFPSSNIEKLTQWTSQPDIYDNSNHEYDYLLGDAYGYKGFYISLRATKGFKNKLELLKETIVPPPAEIYVKYGKNTGWPLPFLYLRRMFSGALKRAFKNHKS